MALFNKLFFSSSSKRSALNTSQSQQYLSQFPFDTSQVRVLLYRECDSRGRRLLFDSSAIQKMNIKECVNMQNLGEKMNYGTQRKTSKRNSIIEISEDFCYKLGRPTGDITSIGEMVFGALAMSFRGTSLKVHWLQSPARILCSQVFLPPVQNNTIANQHSSGNLSSGASISEQHSTESSSVNSFSMPFSVCLNKNLHQLGGADLTNPLDVPHPEISSEATPFSSVADSGYSGTEPWTTSGSSYYQYSTRSSSGSAFSDQGSKRKLSIDSYSGDSRTSSEKSTDSLQRRIFRNISTSFENRTSLSDFIGFIDDNFEPTTHGGSDSCVTRYTKSIDVNESRSNPEIRTRHGTSNEIFYKSRRHMHKRPKLGLAVCITMSESYKNEMERFCCEHIALLESMLCRLRASAENAYINHKNFLQIMLHAWQSTAHWIADLFTAPRLSCPVWLNISSSGNKNCKNLVDTFISDLCWLLSFADTKDTNFFISKLVTVVLTNHLGWVSTVSALNSKSDCKLSDVAKQQAKLVEISQKHPYNALWAQMGDLYGAIGNPPKISRTIIYGNGKHAVEKLLYMLTYFIRCGEICKTSKKEILNKDILEEIMMKTKKDQVCSSSKIGLKRIQTCANNLDLDEGKSKENKDLHQCKNPRENLMNNIPGFVSFRDPLSVQQTLRNNNQMVDAGIEYSPLETSKSKKCDVQDKIKLTITTPDNVELPAAESTKSEGSEAIEAIDIEAVEINNRRFEEGSSPMQKCLWNMKLIKDGLSWEDVKNVKGGVNDAADDKKLNASRNLCKSNSTSTVSSSSQNPKPVSLGRNKTHVSLCDLITSDSTGKSEHYTFGFENFKKKTSPEGENRFALNEQLAEKDRKSGEEKEVVFVLGENEALVNIKKSTEDVSKEDGNSLQANQRRACNHHKKHSGVKFNFEQYPQIATNYMKNKNLDISSCDFFKKPTFDLLNYGPSTSDFAKVQTIKSNSYEQCEYCENSIIRTLQTPSNATELEFETDENYSSTSFSQKETNNVKHSDNLAQIKTIDEGRPKQNEYEQLDNFKHNTQEKQVKLNFIQLPVPDTTSDNSEVKLTNEPKPGLIPSLFIGINDHYIPDMVLQGTLSSPHIWEMKLKEDLALSSHCASFVSVPAENVAIIADMEKWDVRVVSSQTNVLPYASNTSGPVGMSQLVSTMLETVFIMSRSGISSYECLSYLESKLREIYLQSEALAAFLLTTEFCSLNTLTSSLNLSPNDVPLLLSVASTHSPQVTKKYGVSFR